MMVLNILLRRSIKLLRILQRLIKLTSWALRGNKMNLEKQSTRAEIFLGGFLVEDNHYPLCLQVMLLSILHPCSLAWFHVLCK